MCVLYNDFLLVVTVAILLSTQHVVAQDWGDFDDSFKLPFSYEPAASNGPNEWRQADGMGEWAQYPDTASLVAIAGNQCGVTTRPSPIALDQPDSNQQRFFCQDLHEPIPRQIDLERDCSRWELTFAITPYALKAYFPMSDGYCRRPSLTVAGSYDPYTMLWMEIHARSEHVIAGKRYDAEIQMVHAGTGRNAGELLTFSLMVDASAAEDQLEFEWLLQQWKETAQVEDEYCNGRRTERRSRHRTLSEYLRHGNFSNPVSEPTQLERNLQFTGSPCRTDRFGSGCENRGLAPRKRMFPYNLWQSIWYYGYSGSLTSPPCSEIVQWRILDEPIRISRRQYKELTAILTQS
ncbi:MAG: hypothetical protein SGARI_005666, partial [Bacillariaceae sp.]